MRRQSINLGHDIQHRTSPRIRFPSKIEPHKCSAQIQSCTSMRMNQKRTKDTNSRQIVIKDLAEKGRKEIPSLGNIHPRNRETMRMPHGQVLQCPSQKPRKIPPSKPHLLTCTYPVAYASYSSQPCKFAVSSVANANWLEEYGTSLSGMATELALERRQYGPYRQMSPLAKWDPETETHHKYKEGLGEKNAQRNRGSEAHHLAKA